MKEFKTFEDFEYSLKRTPVPELDENLIIRRIQVAQKRRNVRLGIKTAVLVSVLFILLISSLVYGKNVFKPIKLFNIISSINLKDKEGNTSFEYQKIEYDEDAKEKNEEAKNKWKSINKDYAYILYKHKKALKDNELELFVVVDAFKIDESLRILYNDKRFSSLSDLKESSSIKFKAPDILPAKYRFSYGYIKKHQSVDKNLYTAAVELYNKAVKEGKDYITQKFETTDEISEIQLNYKENYLGNDINIWISKGSKQIYDDSVQIEKIDINGHEAIYETCVSSPFKKVIFVDNNGTENLTYTISFCSPAPMGKDLYPEVIEMIESMLE